MLVFVLPSEALLNTWRGNVTLIEKVAPSQVCARGLIQNTTFHCLSDCTNSSMKVKFLPLYLMKQLPSRPFQCLCFHCGEGSMVIRNAWFYV